MRPAIDQITLEGLISLGRERGGLTNDDLQLALPIDSMSAEDIAHVVMQLEEAGVPVDLDESLLVQSTRSSAAPRQGAEILPFPKRPDRPKKVPRDPGAVGSQHPAPTAPPRVNGRVRPAHWAVAGSILVLILAAALLWVQGA